MSLRSSLSRSSFRRACIPPWPLLQTSSDAEISHEALPAWQHQWQRRGWVGGAVTLLDSSEPITAQLQWLTALREPGLSTRRHGVKLSCMCVLLCFSWVCVHLLCCCVLMLSDHAWHLAIQQLWMNHNTIVHEFTEDKLTLHDSSFNLWAFALLC